MSRFAAPLSPRESPPYARGDRPLAPRIVIYEVTQASDDRRYLEPWRSRVTRHTEELSPLQSRQLLSHLARFPKSPTVVLTGGDPFQRDDLAHLVSWGADRDLDVVVAAAPSTRATRQRLRQLRAAGVGRVALEIDGPAAGVHDAIQGKDGLFRRTLRIAVAVRELGIPLQVTTRLTPDNVEYLEQMARLLVGLDIDLWSVQFQVPVENQAHHPRLRSSQYEQVFARLYDLASGVPFPIKVCDAPHYRRFVVRQQTREWLDGTDSAGPRINPWSSLGINDGRGMIFISHVGLIQPGPCLPVACGVFPQDDVLHVYQNSPVFRALRDPKQLKGKCGWCEFHELCGGSRARAFAVTGDAFSQEPDCEYLPRARG